MKETVRVSKVSKRYGSKVVLNKIDLQVEGGRICGLIGPSGAGKTTLIKMMVGLEVPDHGSVNVLGKRMPNLHVLRQIGYMAQSDALYTELTGYENLRFFASLYPLNRKEMKERIHYTAELVNLTDDLTKRVGIYS